MAVTRQQCPLYVTYRVLCCYDGCCCSVFKFICSLTYVSLDAIFLQMILHIVCLSNVLVYKVSDGCLSFCQSYVL